MLNHLHFVSASYIYFDFKVAGVCFFEHINVTCYCEPHHILATGRPLN
jgi:hypothetical protein